MKECVCISHGWMCGSAWAASLNHFDAAGGLPDRTMGGADRNIACALLNQVGITLSPKLPVGYAAPLLQWQQNVKQARSALSCVPGESRHHWHGSLQNRQVAFPACRQQLCAHICTLGLTVTVRVLIFMAQCCCKNALDILWHRCARFTLRWQYVSRLTVIRDFDVTKELQPRADGLLVMDKHCVKAAKVNKKLLKFYKQVLHTRKVYCKAWHLGGTTITIGMFVSHSIPSFRILVPSRPA